jgi:hypothetical protein
MEIGDSSCNPKEAHATHLNLSLGGSAVLRASAPADPMCLRKNLKVSTRVQYLWEYLGNLSTPLRNVKAYRRPVVFELKEIAQLRRLLALVKRRTGILQR